MEAFLHHISAPHDEFRLKKKNNTSHQVYELVIVIIFLPPATQKKNDQSKLKNTKHITDEFVLMNEFNSYGVHACKSTDTKNGWY